MFGDAKQSLRYHAVESVSLYSRQEGPDHRDLLDGPDPMTCVEVDGVERGCTSESTVGYEHSLSEVVGSVTYEEAELGLVALEVYDADFDSNDHWALVEISDLRMGNRRCSS